MTGRVVVLVTIVIGLGACTHGGTKAGPGEPEVTLRLATVENASAPYADEVRSFADRVMELSDGSVGVELDFEVIPWTPTSEQTIIGMVREGKVDMAFVPTRAFDTIGVSTFEPLQAPMLIDSPELAGAVATDDIARGMLEGLGDEDLIGLGLVYEGLRRPLAMNGAVVRESDFEGRITRVVPSELSDRVLAALGATPDHGQSHVVATNGDPYVLAESEFDLGTGFPAGSTVTANVVFFPKLNAILVNPAAFDRLTDDQRRAVRQAGVDTVAASVQTTADDQDAAAALCESGRHVVLAPGGEVEAMRAELETITDQLRADSASARAIDAIETLKASTSAASFALPPACLPPTGDGARLPEPPKPPAAPTP